MRNFKNFHRVCLLIYKDRQPHHTIFYKWKANKGQRDVTLYNETYYLILCYAILCYDILCYIASWCIYFFLFEILCIWWTGSLLGTGKSGSPSRLSTEHQSPLHHRGSHLGGVGNRTSSSTSVGSKGKDKWKWPDILGRLATVKRLKRNIHLFVSAPFHYLIFR